MDFTHHDKVIADILPRIVAYQKEYVKEDSIYFQHRLGVEMPTLVPHDAPFRVSINEAPTRGAKGDWWVTFTVDDGGKRYERRIGYGSKVDVSRDSWTEI